MPINIAIEGCCHGELDKIYEAIQLAEQKNKLKIDLLLICGDFQAVRNRSDLTSMAVPPKYQKMNTFYKYYSGEKVAPVLTIFIGGNHEASNYLQELSYGGWVAPNIYYLGYAGVVQFGGLRIGGMSGIFNYYDYHRGHFEHPPYNSKTIKSVYHVRSLEVFRLKQLKQPLDIFLSHDWPRGIYNYGNTSQLLSKKKFFADEVHRGTLGSPAAEELLHTLMPDYWFSAHLHVKFQALIELKLKNGATKKTTFLALDKCLPGRDFLEILELHPRCNEPKELSLDPEWLCILKSTDHLLSTHPGNNYMPGPGSNEKYDFTVTAEEIKSLCSDFDNLLTVPKNFCQTVEPYNGSRHTGRGINAGMQTNPQTTLLCEMVGISDPFALFSGCTIDSANTSSNIHDSTFENIDFLNNTAQLSNSVNPDEISLSDVEDEKVGTCC